MDDMKRSKGDALANDLFDALVSIKTRNEMARVMKDLCTPQEIKALSERWQVCQLLDAGDLSYRDISEKAGTSLATITRIARFLKDEPHRGYQLLLKKKMNRKK